MTNKKLKVFTAFSGYDSQCLALNRLKKQYPDFDYELVGWSEIDENAIKAHNILFPQYSDRNHGDISKVNWDDVEDFDLLTYSSPCFVSGTKIITNNGVKNIENIKEGDYVLTHTGKYRKVITPMSRFYTGSLYRVNVDNTVVICTPNHPFYCVERGDMNSPMWVEAQNLDKDRHLVKKVVDFKTDGQTPYIENKPIINVDKLTNQATLVFNMEVEEDNSYTANCLFVHNCTDFSLAGKQAGGEEGSGTRSSLLWEVRRCIEAKRPKYLILENVTALVSAKFFPLFQRWCDTVAEYGYENFYQTLNAKDYGIPQNRDRVFLVSIRIDNPDEIVNYNFPNPVERTCKIEDVLEPRGTVDEKYFVKQDKVDEWIVDNENRIAEYVAERNNMKPEDLYFDYPSKQKEKSVVESIDDTNDDKITELSDIEMKVLINNVVESIDVNMKILDDICSDGCCNIEEMTATKTPKKRKKNEVKTTKVGHKVKVIPTPTCTGNVAPTLMATGYATADYKNFYSVGHFPKLGILEVWKEDKTNKK